MSPDAFAAEWIAAWNSHDLDRILSHYADDVVFESPASTRITGDASGRVVGKAALRDYWRQALGRVPDLTFTLTAVYGGSVPEDVQHAMLVFVADSFLGRENAKREDWTVLDVLLCNHRRGV